MAENSKIEWTDHTFNPWWGCTHVHEGCRNCYAETWANRFGVKWGPTGVRRLSSESVWKQPLKWNRAAEKTGVRAKVFCSSMADVFEDWSGPIVNQAGNVAYHFENGINWHSPDAIVGCERVTLSDIRRELFRLIDETPWLDWQLLTKRPENIRQMWPGVGFPDVGVPGTLGRRLRLQNVWLGTSISDQASADKQIPELLKCRDLSPVRFLSCEPLLGPIEFSDVTKRADAVSQLGKKALAGIDWVIVGGESGNGARPMHWKWVLSLRDQCNAAGVPLFFKQWGEWQSGLKTPMDYENGASSFRPGCYHDFGDDSMALRLGKAEAGRQLDGREWNEMPAAVDA